MSQTTLLSELTRRIMRDIHRFQAGNIDYWRHPAGRAGQLKTKLKEGVLALAGRGGFFRKNFDESAADELQFIHSRLSEFEHTYQLFADDASRRVMVEVLAYRILGARHVRLPRNTAEFWARRAEVERSYLLERGSVPDQPRLNRYKIGEVELHIDPLNLFNTFVLEQYAYRKAGAPIEAGAGDVVIDAGGCYGDTAIYFAERVGARGRVFCFEFAPDNLRVLRQNLTANEALGGRVEVIEQPVWERSGVELRFSFAGPATHLADPADQGAVATSTRSIDDLVQAERPARVDFIKMDIEGAELSALRGAEATIRAHRPQLAISVYHRKDDLIAIPAYLESLGLGYEFFLDHFTIYGEETILFARPAR